MSLINAGKCWFCRKTEPISDLYFSREFDTPAHSKCALLAVEKNPSSFEASAICDDIALDNHRTPFGMYDKEFKAKYDIK